MTKDELLGLLPNDGVRVNLPRGRAALRDPSGNLRGRENEAVRCLAEDVIRPQIGEPVMVTSWEKFDGQIDVRFQPQS